MVKGKNSSCSRTPKLARRHSSMMGRPSFRIYAKEQKNLLKAKYPFLKPGQLQMKAKELWGRLPQTEKEFYCSSKKLPRPGRKRMLSGGISTPKTTDEKDIDKHNDDKEPPKKKIIGRSLELEQTCSLRPCLLPSKPTRNLSVFRSKGSTNTDEQQELESDTGVDMQFPLSDGKQLKQSKVQRLECTTKLDSRFGNKSARNTRARQKSAVHTFATPIMRQTGKETSAEDTVPDGIKDDMKNRVQALIAMNEEKVFSPAQGCEGSDDDDNYSIEDELDAPLMFFNSEFDDDKNADNDSDLGEYVEDTTEKEDGPKGIDIKCGDEMQVEKSHMGCDAVQQPAKVKYVYTSHRYDNEKPVPLAAQFESTDSFTVTAEIHAHDQMVPTLTPQLCNNLHDKLKAEDLITPSVPNEMIKAKFEQLSKAPRKRKTSERKTPDPKRHGKSKEQMEQTCALDEAQETPLEIGDQETDKHQKKNDKKVPRKKRDKKVIKDKEEHTHKELNDKNRKISDFFQVVEPKKFYPDSANNDDKSKKKPGVDSEGQLLESDCKKALDLSGKQIPTEPLQENTLQKHQTKTQKRSVICSPKGDQQQEKPSHDKRQIKIHDDEYEVISQIRDPLKDLKDNTDLIPIFDSPNLTSSIKLKNVIKEDLDDFLSDLDLEAESEDSEQNGSQMSQTVTDTMMSLRAIVQNSPLFSQVSESSSPAVLSGDSIVSSLSPVRSSPLAFSPKEMGDLSNGFSPDQVHHGKAKNCNDDKEYIIKGPQEKCGKQVSYSNMVTFASPEGDKDIQTEICNEVETTISERKDGTMTIPKKLSSHGRSVGGKMAGGGDGSFGTDSKKAASGSLEEMFQHPLQSETRNSRTPSRRLVSSLRSSTASGDFMELFNTDQADPFM